MYVYFGKRHEVYKIFVVFIGCIDNWEKSTHEKACEQYKGTFRKKYMIMISTLMVNSVREDLVVLKRTYDHKVTLVCVVQEYLLLGSGLLGSGLLGSGLLGC